MKPTTPPPGPPLFLVLDGADALVVGLTLAALDRSGRFVDGARPGAGGRIAEQLVSAARLAGVGQ